MSESEGEAPAMAAAQRGIQSVEVGGQVLRALAHHGAPMALKDLARGAGMVPPRVHPYLVSFGRIGLVVQNEDGRYALGPLARELGLISLQQSSPVHIATPLLAPLAQHIGHTVALVVWGARGPTIVRIEESPAVLFASMRHGTVFSLTNAASGRLFAAYLPAEVVEPMLEEERLEARQAPMQTPGMPRRERVPTWQAFQQVLTDVRAAGVGRSVGEIVAGINALSAPVFGPSGEIVLAITAIGPDGTFDAAVDGPVALALKACAAEIGKRLGARSASD